MLHSSVSRYPSLIVMKVAISGRPTYNLELGRVVPIPAHQQENAEIGQHTQVIEE